MKLIFQDEEKYIKVNYSRVKMTDGKHEEYTCVFVYGLDEEEPMMLLTNKTLKNKDDVIEIVRCYMYRWRIEEIHRMEKDCYKYEDMRVRTLKAMNTINLILMMLLGYISKIGEEIDEKLLSIKIIERSESLREKVVVYASQIAQGIKEILKYAHVGVKIFKRKDRHRQCSYTKQLSLF